ncbi:MAG: hypothetical protein CL885_00935 [Dehalococcoidia bacterium]|nr:hypothetical protein [Dehalococcoidia bacterium]|tara:strand:+ start:2908 stop:3096 length:189 start_codon:yes stop_codon:yes gene_type:complete
MNNPFENWGMEQASRDVYPEPPPEKPSKKELTNHLLDALIVALEMKREEDIKAIKEQLKQLK